MFWNKLIPAKKSNQVEELRKALHEQIEENVNSLIYSGYDRNIAKTAAKSAVDTVFLRVFMNSQQQGCDSETG